MNEKKYLAKIIARDANGLQVISACCSDSKVKIEDIKFLKKNKIFLLLIERIQKEKNNKEKLKSILKFEYIDSVKSKNINQNNNNDILELLGIDLFRDKKNYNISIYFKNNAFITLLSEILEVTLEDHSEQQND
tara:strand:+ start:154 stop:555 length:402 start_codon:yes stop_codon:yes gene_type:complete